MSIGFVICASWIGCSTGEDPSQLPPKPGAGSAPGAGASIGLAQGGTADSSPDGSAGEGGSAGLSYGGATAFAGASTGGIGASGGAEHDASGVVDATEDDSPVDVSPACVPEKYTASQVPLDAYYVIDRTGSMVEPGWSWAPVGPGEISITGGDCNYVAGQSPLNSKWCGTVYALMGYFSSAESLGSRVAVQHYPIDGYNCSSPSSNTLSNSATGWQLLPGGMSALATSLNEAAPLGAFTPTKAALHGIAGFTAANQTQGRITIGVLITDGAPNSCAPDDGDTLGNVAQAHLQATGIKTYVIGMTGANFTTLEVIAEHGGAPAHTQYCAQGIPSCHYYSVGNGDPQVFANVLNEIKNAAVGCTYKVPGGLAEPDKLVVEYQPGSGAAQSLTKVTGASACKQDSWYTDAKDNIILCPQACVALQADPLATVQVVVNCPGM